MRSQRRLYTKKTGSASNSDHYYIFDELSGDLIDHNGTADMTVFETTRGNGQYLFDGVNDDCRVNNGLIGTDFPISVTVEIKKNNVNDGVIYFSNWVAGQFYTGIFLQLSANGVNCAYGNGEGTFSRHRRNFSSLNYVYDLNYHKISVEFVDAFNVNLWIDGISYAMNYSSGTADFIGIAVETNLFNYQGIYQRGSLKNLQVFNRLLEPSER